MKQLFLGICLLTNLAFVEAQVRPKGKITDAETGAPLPGASIEAPFIGSTMTNESGIFEFGSVKPGKYEIRISNIGYLTHDTVIQFINGEIIGIPMQRINLFMQPIEVKALRAGDKAPFTRTNLSKQDIEQNNLGQDLPFILSQTPSVIINSDAGNGVG